MLLCSVRKIRQAKENIMEPDQAIFNRLFIWRNKKSLLQRIMPAVKPSEPFNA